MDRDITSMLPQMQNETRPALPQDKRFTVLEWQQWPFKLIYKSFLHKQQCMQRATMNLPGVSAHGQHLAHFAGDQVLGMFSPPNFFLTNPPVCAETAKSGGPILF